MAWKLHFIVYCITIFTDIGMTYNLRPHPYWEWQWPYDEFYYTQVTTSGYKYPTNRQSLPFAAFPVEEDQRYIKSRSDYDRSNGRSQGATQVYRMYERSINTGNRQNLQGVSERVTTYPPRIEESTKRSENVTSKVLNSFLKPIRRRGQVDNNKIIFPGPTVSTQQTVSTFKIPESCKKYSFCEEIPDYPQDEVNKIITKLGDKIHSFTLDTIPDTPDINQRVGPTEENLDLCNSQERVVYPQAAEGSDGTWHTLINRQDKPVQGFKIEICEQDGSSCSDIIYFQKGYTGRCKQKYVLRTAAVLEKVGDGFKEVQKQVKMPSCCSCVAKVVII